MEFADRLTCLKKLEDTIVSLDLETKPLTVLDCSLYESVAILRALVDLSALYPALGTNHTLQQKTNYIFENGLRIIDCIVQLSARSSLQGLYVEAKEIVESALPALKKTPVRVSELKPEVLHEHHPHLLRHLHAIKTILIDVQKLLIIFNKALSACFKNSNSKNTSCVNKFTRASATLESILVRLESSTLGPKPKGFLTAIFAVLHVPIQIILNSLWLLFTIPTIEKVELSAILKACQNVMCVLVAASSIVRNLLLFFNFTEPITNQILECIQQVQESCGPRFFGNERECVAPEPVDDDHSVKSKEVYVSSKPLITVLKSLKCDDVSSSSKSNIMDSCTPKNTLFLPKQITNAVLKPQIHSLIVQDQNSCVLKPYLDRENYQSCSVPKQDGTFWASENPVVERKDFIETQSNLTLESTEGFTVKKSSHLKVTTDVFEQQNSSRSEAIKNFAEFAENSNGSSFSDESEQRSKSCTEFSTQSSHTFSKTCSVQTITGVQSNLGSFVHKTEINGLSTEICTSGAEDFSKIHYNLFKDITEIKFNTLKINHCKLLEKLIRTIKYQVNHFSFSSHCESLDEPEFLALCKICGKVLHLESAELHVNDAAHQYSLFLKGKTSSDPRTLVPEIVEDNWKFLNFSPDTGTYNCDLCSVRLGGCANSWTQHFSSFIHRAKFKELPTR